MSRTRILSRVFLLGAFALVASCSTDRPAPLAPEADLIGDVLGTTTSLLSTTGLLKCSPMPRAEASQTIGSGGGFISVGPHSLYIPAGALSSPTTITAVAPTGSINQVQFQPEGLTFAKPATLTMSYANCNLLGKLLPKRIAYIDNNNSILYYLLSLDLLSLKRVQGRVDHFSAYAVAW